MIDELLPNKLELCQVNEKWITELTDWSQYLTLTFRDKEVTADVARHYWLKLIEILNVDAFGKHYRRKVGHSYFGYILATEYQERGAIHFHAMADRPLNYDLLHRVWEHMAGFAWIEPVENKSSCLGYVSKYVMKGGELTLFINTRRKLPWQSKQNNPFLPYWWQL